MEYSLYKKGLVLGVIVLFVGASVVSSTGITSVEKEQEHTDDAVSSEMHCFDVHQPVNPTLIFKSRTDWNYNWSYVKKIMINHTMVDDNLTNFPVLIVNTSSDFSTHAQPDGDDFVFVDETNTTQYNHEIEYYDNTTGELIVWVNVTSLSSTEDTILFLYYGNPDCENQENVEGVWDANYTAVWHMNDNTTSTITDSTSNNHNGNKKASGEPVESTGLAGYGQLFDGANDYISVLDSPDWNFSSSDFTIELWLKNTDAGDDYTYFMGQYINAFNYWIPQIYTGQLGWGDGQDGGTNHNCGAFTPTQNEWTNIVWSVANGTELNCYVNTTDYGSATIIEVGDLADPLCIGTYDAGSTTNVVKGVLDEVRISNNARNASWINTSYHNQNDPESFVNVSVEKFTNIPPIANFTYTPTNPIQKETIQFNDTSVDPDGNITTWQWDFGDGNTSTLQNPTHTYGDWGNYTVILNVTDDFGTTNETSQIVYVANSIPIANFTYTPPNPAKNETIYFTDTSTDIDGIIVAWYWDFDDGYSSTLQNPIHEYSNEGTYNVTLTVTDDDGATDTYQIAIVVTVKPNHPPTTPDIDGPTSGKVGVEYTYTISGEDPDGDYIYVLLEWGDGTDTVKLGPYDGSYEITEKHVWEEKGTYTIRAKAKDEHGESEWGTLEVTMPKSKPFDFNFNLFGWLFERFPNAFPILRYILGL